MSEIYFAKYISRWGEKGLLVFRAGERCTPILFLDEQDIKKFEEEIKKSWEVEK